jgi:cytochrome P450 family 3 subfamily A
MVLSGYSIPAGSHVWLQQQVSASDPRNFPDPRKFLPERFLRGHPEESKAHPYAHMQFSHGRNNFI